MGDHFEAKVMLNAKEWPDARSNWTFLRPLRVLKDLTTHDRSGYHFEAEVMLNAMG